MDDQATFDKRVWALRLIGGTLLTEFFGDRCHEFHQDCEICKRWSHLDSLTENPFDASKIIGQDTE